MENARKMLLVQPETLNRLQHSSQQAPETNVLSALDREMVRILKLTTLTDFEKWTLYKQTLQKYLHFTNENKKAVVLPIVNTESSTDGADVKTSNILTQTLNVIPLALRSNAELLYKYLQEQPDITWDSRGVVSINNVQLQGSNITDLISDAVRDRKTSNPTGWELFSKTLATANVPETYIGNSRRRKFIRKQREPYTRSATPRKHTTPTTTNSIRGWARYSF